MNTIASQSGVAAPQPLNVAETGSADFKNMSPRAMILAFQAQMKKLYDTYAECHAALEQNVAELQVIAYKQAVNAKDARMKAERDTGIAGLIGAGFNLFTSGVGGYLGYKNPTVGFGMGVDVGSHLGSPASGAATYFTQILTAGTRNKAEEAQIHADLARNVADSAAREAGKAQDNKDQHHEQYVRDANQLTQELMAATKATISR